MVVICMYEKQMDYSCLFFAVLHEAINITRRDVHLDESFLCVSSSIYFVLYCLISVSSISGRSISLLLGAARTANLMKVLSFISG